MIAAHICERDLPLRDFVVGFEGLARKPGARRCARNGAKLKGGHLSDLVRGKDVNMPSVTRLLEAMQNHSRPVQPKRLGLIGRDHLKQHFDSLGATKGFKYDQKNLLSMTRVCPSCVKPRSQSGRMHWSASRRIIGLNWSPIFKIPSGAIGEAISSCQVNSSDPVVLLVHVARPRFEFTDHGKGALA